MRMYLCLDFWYLTSYMRHTSKILAYNLFFRRTSLGYTQKQFAEKAGISLRTYQLLESNQTNPTLDIIVQISTALSVGTHKLISLASLRVQTEFDLFFSGFCAAFEDFQEMVTLRTCPGSLLWGNKPIRDSLGSAPTFPMDLLALYTQQPEPRALVKGIFAAESRGVTEPYILPGLPGTNQFYQVYPVLIYPIRGSLPLWTATFCFDISQTAEASHKEFCEKLVDLVYHSIQISPKVLKKNCSIKYKKRSMVQSYWALL